MRIAEEDRVEEMKALMDITKATMIKLLGLDVVPVEDDNGRLRHPKDTEIIPLSLLCGSEAILSEVLERNKQLVEQEKIEEEIEGGTGNPVSEMTADELDELMNDMGDIEFDPDDDLTKRLEWDSVEAKTMRKQLIQVLDVPGINKKSKVIIQEIEEADPPEFNNSTGNVVELVEREE